MATWLVRDARDTHFHPYPVHLLMAVVDRMPDAEETIVDLLRVGVPKEDIHSWFDEGVEHHRR